MKSNKTYEDIRKKKMIDSYMNKEAGIIDAYSGAINESKSYGFDIPSYDAGGELDYGFVKQNTTPDADYLKNINKVILPSLMNTYKSGDEFNSDFHSRLQENIWKGPKTPVLDSPVNPQNKKDRKKAGV